MAVAVFLIVVHVAAVVWVGNVANTVCVTLFGVVVIVVCVCVLSLFNARHLTARLGLSFPAHVRSLCSAQVIGKTRCTKLCTFALSCAALPSPWIGLEQVCNVGPSVGIRTCCVASRKDSSPRQWTMFKFSCGKRLYRS